MEMIPAFVCLRWHRMYILVAKLIIVLAVLYLKIRRNSNIYLSFKVFTGSFSKVSH